MGAVFEAHFNPTRKVSQFRSARLKEDSPEPEVTRSNPNPASFFFNPLTSLPLRLVSLENLGNPRTSAKFLKKMALEKYQQIADTA